MPVPALPGLARSTGLLDAAATCPRAGTPITVTMAVWVRGLGVRTLLDPVDADSLRPSVNIIFACRRREKQQPPPGHRLARMFRPSSLLCSTCNNTDVASSSY
jgi:hypothetical protein